MIGSLGKRDDMKPTLILEHGRDDSLTLITLQYSLDPLYTITPATPKQPSLSPNTFTLTQHVKMAEESNPNKLYISY